MKETTETTKNEEKHFGEQIKLLVPYKTVIDGLHVSVNYKLSLTMVDGKVCIALTSVSSAQRCYICKATSKDFNEIDKILKTPVCEENLQYGISSLHAWIRAFECCLHLSYKLNTQKWQARKGDKLEVKERESVIQEAFKKELGLIVDVPKQGSGTSNDGNTARRFFQNYSISAKITGVDENLILRFYTLLLAISSGHEINVNKFENCILGTTCQLQFINF